MDEPAEPDDDMRSEYDFDSMTILPRGRFAPEREGMRMAILAPDVASVFTSDHELNAALRLVIELRTMPLAGECVRDLRVPTETLKARRSSTTG